MLANEFLELCIPILPSGVGVIRRRQVNIFWINTSTLQGFEVCVVVSVSQ